MSDIITAVYENGLLRPLERLSLREHQTVRLHGLSSQVRVSATAARRKVSRFVLNEISYLMGGGEPTLVMGKRTIWRVPVILTFPTHGPVGTVATIDVDAETGELHTSNSLRRLPTVLRHLLPVFHQKQKQRADCLAACAAMVLNYLGCLYPYQRI